LLAVDDIELKHASSSNAAVDDLFQRVSHIALYRGRQVPYTIIKFVGFYQTQNFVYDEIYRRTGKSKNDFSDASQLAITFGCGYWAGIFCAITTQPMDNLVSMAGGEDNAGKSFGQLAKEMGTRDLFLRGLSTRIIMIGTLTGLQWWIYGTWKSMCGLGTS